MDRSSSLLHKARRRTLAATIALALAAAGCRAPGRADEHSARAHARHEVERTLDAFHAAASRADLEQTFDQLAPDARFLGTDASEHWDVLQFRAYCAPYFAQGRGWTYRPRERWIAFDERLETAWFDERLDNDAYGELRGTGVLRRTDERWRIAHYNMSFPVPNELTRELVELIRVRAAATATATPSSTDPR